MRKPDGVAPDETLDPMYRMQFALKRFSEGQGK